MPFDITHFFSLIARTIVFSKVKNIIEASGILKSLKKDESDWKFHVIVD